MTEVNTKQNLMAKKSDFKRTRVDGKKEKKRGNLSRKECEEIVLLVEKGLSAKQIADNLDRTIKPVLRYIQDHYLTYQGMTNHEQERMSALEKLRKTALYESIKSYTPEKDLELYEDYVIGYCLQLKGDILFSEMQTLHQLGEIHIETIRNRREKNKNLKTIEKLEKEKEIEHNKYPPGYDFANQEDFNQHHEKIEKITEELAILQNTTNSFEVTYLNLVKQSNQGQKELKTDRATRVKHVEGTKSSTFTEYLSVLKDEKFREAEGRQAELFKLAKEKQEELMGAYHKYTDGTLDRPFLNDRTVMRDKDDDDDK